MREFLRLVINETEKVLRKKRFLVIVLILLILIPVFVYAEYRQIKTTVERLGTDDWRLMLQQQIVDMQNRLGSARLPEEWRKSLQVRIQQQQYYLEHDINPAAPGAPTFVRHFMDRGINLFVPLLVMIVSTDIVSGERSEGTIKLLLTRPVRRWKILLSKYVTMLLFVSVIVLTVAVLSYLLSGIVFGYYGWDMPVLTGFIVENGQLNTEYAHLVPQWQYILMTYGLGWFVCVVVGTISFMLSVLVRNTPTGMGVMLAALIAGNILQGFASSWEEAKYIFSVNLELTDYLEGTLPPIEGMTLSFSLAVLAVWALVSLLVAFLVFTRQDILN
ncbi:ABC transporter permease subunit [Bacillaceae bacterium]